MKRKGIFRKTLAVALAAAMTLAAAGCGGKDTGSGTTGGGDVYKRQGEAVSLKIRRICQDLSQGQRTDRYDTGDDR